MLESRDAPIFIAILILILALSSWLALAQTIPEESKGEVFGYHRVQGDTIEGLPKAFYTVWYYRSKGDFRANVRYPLGYPPGTDIPHPYFFEFWIDDIKNDSVDFYLLIPDGRGGVSDIVDVTLKNKTRWIAPEIIGYSVAARVVETYPEDEMAKLEIWWLPPPPIDIELRYEGLTIDGKLVEGSEVRFVPRIKNRGEAFGDIAESNDVYLTDVEFSARDAEPSSGNLLEDIEKVEPGKIADKVKDFTLTIKSSEKLEIDLLVNASYLSNMEESYLEPVFEFPLLFRFEFNVISPRALEEKGDRYKMLGDIENARYWYSRAAEIYLKLGRYEDAANAYIKGEMWFEAAGVYYKYGKYDTAAKLYLEAARRFNQSERFEDARISWMMAANCYERIRDYVNAGKYYEMAQSFLNASRIYDLLARIAPEDKKAEYYYRAGENYYRAGLYEKAADRFHNAGAFDRAGEAWEKAGEPLRAVEEYALGELYFQAAEVAKSYAMSAPDYREAAEYFEKAAEYYLRAGNITSARECYELALEKYRALGDSEKMKDVERKLESLNPPKIILKVNVSSREVELNETVKLAITVSNEGGLSASNIMISVESEAVEFSNKSIILDRLEGGMEKRFVLTGLAKRPGDHQIKIKMSSPQGEVIRIVSVRIKKPFPMKLALRFLLAIATIAGATFILRAAKRLGREIRASREAREESALAEIVSVRSMIPRVKAKLSKAREMGLNTLTDELALESVERKLDELEKLASDPKAKKRIRSEIKILKSFLEGMDRRLEDQIRSG